MAYYRNNRAPAKRSPGSLTRRKSASGMSRARSSGASTSNAALAKAIVSALRGSSARAPRRPAAGRRTTQRYGGR
ncbi:TPA_asm: hypothetical protein [Microviridae sp.]|nr:TPA_asm: hypothetical protein [Microviridae sp.]